MIVIPMAGLSSRFFRAGYKLPKYMLNLHGYPVFDHALGSFSSFFQSHRFLIICRDVFETPDFVRERTKSLGLSSDRLSIVVLGSETGGQAETVAEGLRIANVEDNVALTIFNIDTFRPGFAFPSEIDLNRVDGFLEVFCGEGDHWSFARLEKGSNRVLEVAEKVRISKYCSDGLYFFRSTHFFRSLFSQVKRRDPATLLGNEYFVAPLYNYAIRGGCDIRCSFVDIESIRFCGTPEEYYTLQKTPAFLPFNGCR